MQAAEKRESVLECARPACLDQTQLGGPRSQAQDAGDKIHRQMSSLFVMEN